MIEFVWYILSKTITFAYKQENWKTQSRLFFHYLVSTLFFLHISIIVIISYDLHRNPLHWLLSDKFNILGIYNFLILKEMHVINLFTCSWFRQALKAVSTIVQTYVILCTFKWWIYNTYLSTMRTPPFSPFLKAPLPRPPART